MNTDMISKLLVDDKVHEPRTYKGITFVHMHDLSPAQVEIMKDTLTGSDFIKILIDGQVLKQCLQYHDYLKWYGRVYAPLQEAQ
jgi:hypothetical protein